MFDTATAIPADFMLEDGEDYTVRHLETDETVTGMYCGGAVTSVNGDMLYFTEADRMAGLVLVSSAVDADSLMLGA